MDDDDDHLCEFSPPNSHYVIPLSLSEPLPDTLSRSALRPCRLRRDGERTDDSGADLADNRPL